MTDTNSEFFTQKHEILTRISTASNIAAWIAIVFFGVYAILQFLQIISMFDLQGIKLFWQEDPFIWINSFLSILRNFLNGVIYWLVLKGISLGLKMIVETDLNYRGKLEGEILE